MCIPDLKSQEVKMLYVQRSIYDIALFGDSDIAVTY